MGPDWTVYRCAECGRGLNTNKMPWEIQDLGWTFVNAVPVDGEVEAVCPDCQKEEQSQPYTERKGGAPRLQTPQQAETKRDAGLSPEQKKQRWEKKRAIIEQAILEVLKGGVPYREAMYKVPELCFERGISGMWTSTAFFTVWNQLKARGQIKRHVVQKVPKWYAVEP